MSDGDRTPARSPRDWILASLLTLFILTSTFGVLRLYTESYRVPVQNQLPQGSFTGSGEEALAGWSRQMGTCLVRQEMTAGNSPLGFLRLGPGGETGLTTSLPLAPGWNSLHISVWARRPDLKLRGEGLLLVRFYAEHEELENRKLELSDLPTSGWHSREALIKRPDGAVRAELTVRWWSPEGVLDLAELWVVPRYYHGRIPTH